jgi:hypothetical protein
MQIITVVELERLEPEPIDRIKARNLIRSSRDTVCVALCCLTIQVMYSQQYFIDHASNLTVRGLVSKLYICLVSQAVAMVLGWSIDEAKARNQTEDESDTET